MNIGHSIRKIRVEKGLSQGELAKLCELSPTSMSQIELGIKRPNPSNLKKICSVLEVPEALLYLYCLEKDDVPENKKALYDVVYPGIEDMIKKLVQKD
jgi:transcriptional regulator with XRE-family HTH domain